MTKQKKFADLSPRDAAAKRNELIKELVKFRVSMDTSVVQGSSGVPGLLRDLKVLGRMSAAKAAPSK